MLSLLVTSPYHEGGAMGHMQAVHYRDREGVQPVAAFVEALPWPARAAVDHLLERLNMLSPTDPPLPFPYSSQVEGELRELRCHYGRRLFRILYRRSGNLFVLLHAFEKRTAAVPETDKAVARRNWEDFRTRMDARPRQPPRAAGRDAP
jgi:phage-related protein